jgi:hypothetical protein
MRSHVLAAAALLIGCCVDTALAGDAKLVSAEQKANCKFIKFITVKGSPDAALKSALDQASRSGGDGFVVLNSTDSATDGEVVLCKP